MWPFMSACDGSWYSELEIHTRHLLLWRNLEIDLILHSSQHDDFEKATGMVKHAHVVFSSA